MFFAVSPAEAAARLVSATPGRCAGLAATIVSTASSAVVQGTARADVVLALGPNSLVRGLGGNDIICVSRAARVEGGPGRDTVYGSAWADTLDGGDGADVIHGGSGGDTIRGGAAGDRIDAGPGADVVIAGSGADVVDGGRGADRILGGEGDDFLLGGSGDDTMVTGPGRDAADGQAGRDRVVADSRDTVVRGPGDIVTGSPRTPVTPRAPVTTPRPVLEPVVATTAPASPGSSQPAPTPPAPSPPPPPQAPTPPAAAPEPRDTAAPDQVRGLYAQSSGGAIELTWEPSSDDVAVTSYVVTRSLDPHYEAHMDNVLLREVVGSTSGTTFTDIPPDLDVYHYFVTALDATGKASATIDATSATVGRDSIAPVSPDQLRIASSAAAISLSWTYCPGTRNNGWTCEHEPVSQAGFGDFFEELYRSVYDNVGISRYSLERSTSPSFPIGAATQTISIQAGLSFTDVPDELGIVYFYRVSAIDAAGNIGSPSPVQAASRAVDRAPPSAPTSAWSTDVWEQYEQVGWQASNDDVWVTAYIVERSLVASFATDSVEQVIRVSDHARTEQSFTYRYDLRDNPRHYFRITAVDASGNRSAATTAFRRP